MDSRRSSRKTVLAFGPQALAFNQDSFSNLRTSIVTSSALNWVPRAIEGLTEHYEKIATELPQLSIVPGVHLLKALNEWLATGNFTDLITLPRLPNIILAPISVLSQLVAYRRYIELVHPISKGFNKVENTEIVGFCTGLLTALAVSLSDTEVQLENHGGVALRLAILIGATVDAQDLLDGGSQSVSTVWKTPHGLEMLDELIRDTNDVSLSELYIT